MIQQDDDDRIREIERVLLDEADREIWYDDAYGSGWKASALPVGVRMRHFDGPFSGTGMTKLLAAESLLADWRNRGVPRG